MRRNITESDISFDMNNAAWDISLPRDTVAIKDVTSKGGVRSFHVILLSLTLVCLSLFKTINV